jgi:hypothetical protein
MREKISAKKTVITPLSVVIAVDGSFAFTFFSPLVPARALTFETWGNNKRDAKKIFLRLVKNKQGRIFV